MSRIERKIQEKQVRHKLIDYSLSIVLLIIFFFGFLYLTSY